MSASDSLGEDATNFFSNMLINNLQGEYEELLVSPGGIKNGVLHYMDQEIAKGSDGYICIKANSMTERGVIDKIVEASKAGVEIQLILRGICCILPGIPGYTDNVHVTSIVGRYLEHARIFCFGKGENAKLFISSADLMTRNLNCRVETACPIHDKELCKQLQWILSCQLRDNVKARKMMPDGLYRRKEMSSTLSYNSQEEFMKVSLHRKEEFIPEKQTVFQLIGSFFSKFFQMSASN